MNRHALLPSSLALVSILAVGSLAAQEPAQDAKQGAAPGWETDFARAQALAAEQGKDLLIDFTGSDWCVWCKRLKSEVFDEAGFAAATEQFVLVELDYPRDAAKLGAAVRKQNEALLGRYAVSSYPTILLADAQGLPYARTGYMRGGVEPYLAHLEELREAKAVRDAHVATANAAVGVEAAKSWHAALESLPSDLDEQLRVYKPWMERIVELDEEGEAGLRPMYQEKLRQMLVTELMNELRSRMVSILQAADRPEPKHFRAAASAAAEFLAEHEDLPNETRREVMIMRGSMLERGEKIADAVKTYRAAAELLPDDPGSAQLLRHADSLQQQADKAKDGESPAPEKPPGPRKNG